MERIISCLEPLLTSNRVRRMQAVLAARSDHVAFVFERMVDPHNLSAVLRSMDGLGFQDAHLIVPDEALGLSRGITIGAERWLTLHRHEDAAACVQALKRAGYRVLAGVPGDGAGAEAGAAGARAERIARNAPGQAGSRAGEAGKEAAGQGGTPLEEVDFRQRTALVFGNERDGVTPQLLGLADGAYRIAMVGFVESFNLSVAAAICAHHARGEITRLGREAPEPGSYLLSPARRQEIYAGWLKNSVKRSEKILKEAGLEEG